MRLILERSNPSVLARVKQANDGFRAVPLDDRLLFELHLQSNGGNLEQAIDHLVHVQVMRYPLGQQPPLGKIARMLGGDTDASDVDIVCCKYDLPPSFSDAVQQVAKALPTKIGKPRSKSGWIYAI